MNEAVIILTPVGRLVQGNLWEPQTKDRDGNPLTDKNGQPRVDYFFAIAIPKTDQEYAALWAQIHAVGQVAFPHLFDAAGNAAISWKIVDGDSQVPNKEGNRPYDKEGFPGCWVLNFSSGFAPRVCDRNADILTDPQSVKRGYYIRVRGTVRGNNSSQQPGVYLNHNLVQFAAYGKEISTGPDPKEAFGGKPVGALPPGASATPLAPPSAPPSTPTPGAPGAPSAPGAPPVAPSGPQVGVPSGPSAPAPTPAPAPPPVAPSGIQPAPAPAPPPVAPSGIQPAPSFLNTPVAEYRLHNGDSYTADQLRAGGWTDEQIGQMVPVVGDRIPY